jgi:hypothetical protein
MPHHADRRWELDALRGVTVVVVLDVCPPFQNDPNVFGCGFAITILPIFDAFGTTKSQ